MASIFNQFSNLNYVQTHPLQYNIDSFMSASYQRELKLLFFDDNYGNFTNMRDGFIASGLGSISRSVYVPQSPKIYFNIDTFIPIIPNIFNQTDNDYHENVRNMTLFMEYNKAVYNYYRASHNDNYVNALTIPHLNSIINWANLRNDLERVVIFDFDELLSKTAGPYPYNSFFRTIETTNYFRTTGVRINDFTIVPLPLDFGSQSFTVRPSLLAAYYLFGSKERFEKIKEMFNTFQANNIKFYILTNNGLAQDNTSFIDILREVHPSFTVRKDDTTRIMHTNLNANPSFGIRIPDGYHSPTGNVLSAKRYSLTGMGEYGNKYDILLSYFKNPTTGFLSFNKLYLGTANSISPEPTLGGMKKKAKSTKPKAKSTKAKTTKAKTTKAKTTKAKTTKAKSIKVKSIKVKSIKVKSIKVKSKTMV